MEHDDESESEEFEEDDNDDDEDSDSDDMKDNDIEEESEDYGSGEELEDKFLKIKELEKYLKEDEEREYGLKAKRKKAGGKKASKDDDETEGGEDNDEDEDDQLGLFEEGDEDDELESARYEDFFVSNKKKPEKKRKQIDRSDDWNAEDEQEDIEIDGSDDSDAEDLQVDNENDESDDSDAEDDLEDNQEGKLSKHEMEQKKLQAKIKEMEKANLDTKTWTMQGEVTAAKRPLNSALEVDLDFEHNVRPAPVITEEVTASVEEIIKKRVVEGRFDGAQRAPKLPSKAPREFKELDENKSKRGLADLYEEEYMEKTGLAPASLSFSDELKKEANILFKRLIFKLNALSHFHFAPKPVVEDMTIETNLPALAMEEVAPVAVSDAAMLAPEEVFAGKGDVKEETELTQEDKKRRRAKKKRKFKAEQSKRMAKKLKETPVITQGEGKVTVVKA